MWVLFLLLTENKDRRLYILCKTYLSKPRNSAQNAFVIPNSTIVMGTKGRPRARMITATCQNQKCESVCLDTSFPGDKTLFWVWQRVETLTATGCFFLNKNHTLSWCASDNYSSRDSEKPFWLWLLAYFIFNLVRCLQRPGSKIYRMMSQISSPSRLRANRLLPQWLGEQHWKVAAALRWCTGRRAVRLYIWML